MPCGRRAVRWGSWRGIAARSSPWQVQPPERPVRPPTPHPRTIRAGATQPTRTPSRRWPADYAPRRHRHLPRRGHIAETPHGHIKHNLGLRQFSLRLTKVQTEWTFVQPRQPLQGPPNCYPGRPASPSGRGPPGPTPRQQSVSRQTRPQTQGLTRAALAHPSRAVHEQHPKPQIVAVHCRAKEIQLSHATHQLPAPTSREQPAERSRRVAIPAGHASNRDRPATRRGSLTDRLRPVQPPACAHLRSSKARTPPHQPPPPPGAEERKRRGSTPGPPTGPPATSPVPHSVIVPIKPSR